MAPRPTRLTTLVAAGATALALAGCGSGGQVQEAADTRSETAAVPSQEAPEAGGEVSTQEFMDRIKSPGPDRLGSFTLEMDMTLEGEEMTMAGAADLRGEQPAMQLAVEMSGMGSMELIMVEGQVYLALPGVTEEGQYLAVDPGEMGLDLTDLTSQLDLESTWDAWDHGAQSVTYVGNEEVDGQQLHHYTVTVDAAAAFEATGETAFPGAPETIDYEVWLDEENLMRRVTFDAGGTTVELRADDWGEEVDVQAPDPSQLVDFSF